MATTRISDEPAFVLHRYDWSESSLILEVFTRHFGRMAVVAKGVKRPNSSFRPILLPMQALHLGFGGDAEIKTLKSAHWQGGHVMPAGEALLAGYYLNELLMRTLAREDPHPVLFDIYAQVVALLAGETAELRDAGLRAFELLLLREIGVLPALDVQTLTLQSLSPQQPYKLVPEAGLRQADEDDRAALLGVHWLTLQQGLALGQGLHEMLAACLQLGAALKPQLRALLHYHCGVQTLQTRQLMIDMQSL